ncbi:MAG: aminoacyl-tRNA hydrolase [Clostridia bacterium]
MILIVGLGNPGAKYKNTYHNLGFMAVDAFAKKLKLKISTKECSALTASGRYNGVDFVVAEPQTFMNLSGEAVRLLVRKYGIDVATELMIVYDDADLPVGKMRLREEGSAGTHNGMRNIVAELNTTNFKRLRIGMQTVALKEKEVEIIDHVLSKIPYEFKEVFNSSIEVAATALIDFVDGKDIGRIEETVNKRK